jgi:hypothetical protein
MSDTPVSGKHFAKSSNSADEYARLRANHDLLERELAAAKAWKDAVIDAAVVGWTYCAADEDDPRGCLSRIMAMNTQIALDPAVSSEAAALIERGRQEVREELAAAKADAAAEQESRGMFVARLEKMQEQGDQWLTVVVVLALLNDCDRLASLSAALAKEPT